MPADVIKSFAFNSAQVGAEIDNRVLGCQFWVLNYTTTGFTAFSLQFESSVDGLAFAVFPTLHVGANPTTQLSQGQVIFIGFGGLVRVNLSSVTGQGLVSGSLQGFQQIPSPVPPGGWVLFSAPAAGAQATVTKAAAPGVRHVLTGWSFSAVSAAAPVATDISAVVNDGANPVAVFNGAFPATANFNDIPAFFQQLNWTGQVNTAASAAFTSGQANVLQTVCLYGYDTTQ